MEKKLTLKQTKFIKEYIKTGNGTQSAIKAGHSKKTARFIASENLTKPNIIAKIEKVMNKSAAEMGINAEFVLGNLKYFAGKKKIKWASHAIKSNELLGKNLKLFHDTEVDVKLQHQERQKQLEDLE